MLLRSWDDFFGAAPVWNELNAEWPQFGATPIAIDHTTLVGQPSFTYAQLAASGADVLILSNPAGGKDQYSPDEIEAVRRYARGGHNLIGTYKVFQWRDTVNNALAPIFGLRGDLRYTLGSVQISNEFQVLKQTPLTRGIGPAHWDSSGYPFTEIRQGLTTWDQAGFAGAVPVAQCDGFKAVVTLFRTPQYAAVYISNMPEYYGAGAADKQLLYNAITLSAP